MAFTLSPAFFPIRSFNRRRLYSMIASPMKICSTMSNDSTLLLDAAKFTVDTYVESGMVIGLGSGLASAFAIQYLGRQLRSGALQNVVGVPTSVGSASEAAKAGVPLDQYNDGSKIDLAFDDADVIEEETLSAIIGRQKMQSGESVVQEKIILKAAGKLVLIAIRKHYKRDIEGSIPILIKSINWLETAEEIDDLFLGDAEVWRRSSIGLVDPLGGEFPLITKEGHNVLDLIFTSPILNLADVADSLDKIDGIIEHCVLSRIPCTAVIASEDGVGFVDNTVVMEGTTF